MHLVFYWYLGEFGCSKLQYRVYLMSSRQVCTFDVGEDEMQSIKMTSNDGSIQVDLPTGRVTVDASVQPLAEYLTLTFAIGIMFVTMQKPAYLLQVMIIIIIIIRRIKINRVTC